jgi:glycosyltransferase involved in cell wall biosynthesis
VVTSLEIGNDRFLKALELIKTHHLDDRFLLLHRTDLSFVRLVEAADVMIRPTLTDGDALSVREALHMGKPVIASDIVSRPDGVVVYQTNNTDDLMSKLNELPLGLKPKTEIITTTNFYHQLLLQVLQQ